MTEKFKKGWFWFCPIYWDGETLFPRYESLFWLLGFTTWLHHSMLVVSDFIGLDIEKGYPIKINKS